jgi:hypothetical protein
MFRVNLFLILAFQISFSFSLSQNKLESLSAYISHDNELCKSQFKSFVESLQKDQNWAKNSKWHWT